MNLKNFSILFLSLTLLSCKKDFIPTESSRIEIDDFIVDDWLLYQLNCDRTGSSRGLTRGYFFERSGKLVASTIQEGLMRIRE